MTFVSALMITGKSPDRRPLADVAVRCFLAQTWDADYRQLTIINTAPAAWFEGIDGVHEVHRPKADRFSLGRLRNISMESAPGDLFIQWDDDDWHHPERIAWQVEHHRPGMLSLLQRQYRIDLNTGQWGTADGQWCNKKFHAIVGTMLHGPTSIRYPRIARGEDTVFAKTFRRQYGIHVQDNPPELYVRLSHGNNTWPQQHVMRPAVSPRGLHVGDAAFIDQIKAVYAESRKNFLATASQGQ